MAERPAEDPLAALGLPRTVHVLDCRRVLGPLAASGEFAPEDRRRWFEGRVPGRDFALRVHPAVVAPIQAGDRSLLDHLDGLPDDLGTHLVLLMQAGRSSMGWFEGGEPVATKSLSRYVVRGRGRAQPAHLKTKGKSRYGSRLRLQNARLLMEETSERLRSWWDERGPAEAVLVGAPRPLLASLFETDPPPPFDPDGPLRRIPLDLPRPTSELLVRAYRSCCYARLEPLEPGAEP